MKQNKPLDISAFRHLYPFRSRYMDINGLKYHFIDEGTGDAVVMVHGNPTWSFYFRELVKALAPRFRVIVPDHIGCGLSDKPDPSRYDYRLKSRIDDLETFLERLRLPVPITLILHDWGGMIGMGYAVRHPQNIRGFVIMNTAAFMPPKGKKLPARLRLVRNTGPLAVLAVQGLNLFARGALLMAAYKRLPGDVKSGLIAPYNSWDNRIATLKFVQDIPLGSYDASYGPVKAVQQNLTKFSQYPMLILWGKHDFVFDGTYLDEWRRRFPRAEIELFADAGHYVLEDVPQKIVPRVKEFLSRHH